ncbi:MAG: glycosyltransferase family 4 protein [Gammaproteobacteria bacterium]|nr:glycosyltransferase family 4 protein [Gammaproteobacteria bacterium]
MPPELAPELAIVLKGYPRLSETFVAQEIRALEQRGYRVCIISLRHPYDPATHPVHAEIEAPVYYLPEYLHDDPLRVLRALLALCWRARFWTTLMVLLQDFRRDRSRNRLRRFGQALVMARETPPGVRHYYTHFMHTPASVSYYASLISGRSWSISAHAKDIWTIEAWELTEKLASADWLVTCTAANHAYLSSLGESRDKVTLLYHGLDFARFPSPPEIQSTRDGSDPEQPVRLVSVGRAVVKKGYDYLLQALAQLPPELHWRFTHIGGGELLDELQRQARDLGLDGRIDWRGALPQTEVIDAYRHADLFVLPSRIADDGDRDGLPNVLMEAQSQRLACLSTGISGIPELVNHGETGWLVTQQDPAQLRDALATLIADPALRARLAAAGEQRVRAEFSMQGGIDTLDALLQDSLGQT